MQVQEPAVEHLESVSLRTAAHQDSQQIMTPNFERDAITEGKPSDSTSISPP